MIKDFGKYFEGLLFMGPSQPFDIEREYNHWVTFTWEFSTLRELTMVDCLPPLISSLARDFAMELSGFFHRNTPF